MIFHRVGRAGWDPADLIIILVAKLDFRRPKGVYLKLLKLQKKSVSKQFGGGSGVFTPVPRYGPCVVATGFWRLSVGNGVTGQDRVFVVVTVGELGLSNNCWPLGRLRSSSGAASLGHLFRLQLSMSRW